MGGGWLLQSGNIITCHHVVDKFRLGKEFDPWIVYARAPAIGSPAIAYEVLAHLPVRVVGQDNAAAYTGDLAILKPHGEKKIPCQKVVASGRARQGRNVAAYGFPAQVEGGQAGQSGAGWIGSRDGVGRYEVMHANGTAHKLQAGFSGSPVIDSEQERVIGIFAVDRARAERGLLIPIQEIWTWLDSVGTNEPEISNFGKWPPQRLSLIEAELFGQYRPVRFYDQRVRLRKDPNVAEPAASESTDYDPELDLHPSRMWLRPAETSSCVVIAADGGMGKSTYLFQIAELLEHNEIDYVWLDLNRMIENDSDLNFLDGSLTEGIQKLLKEMRVGPSNTNDLFERTRQLVIIADGINEVGRKANLLLDLLVWYANNHTNISIFCSTRRTSEHDFGKFPDITVYDILPISMTEVRSAIGTALSGLPDVKLKFLSRPQLLKIAQKIAGDLAGFEMESMESVFEAYLLSILEQKTGSWNSSKFIKNPSDRIFTIDALGEFAFNISDAQKNFQYILHDTWITNTNNFLSERKLPVDAASLTKQLVDNGIVLILGEPPSVRFQHSLYQEWLAARHFSKLDSSQWDGAGFDAISLDDTSDDGLRMGLQMVGPQGVEQFLTKMYDWRWQRVLDLAEKDTRGLSEELRKAFLGLNALRLHDPFQHTKAATAAALEMHAAAEDEFARGLLDTCANGGFGRDGENDVIQILKDHFREPTDHPAVEIWRDMLFVEDNQRTSKLDVLRRIADENPFLGWSASNLLRYHRVRKPDVVAAQFAYETSFRTALAAGKGKAKSDPGLRWRIVHLLGAAAGPSLTRDIVDWLLKVWGNEKEHRDVRFGACRSLLELALLRHEVRPHCFEQMTTMLESWAGKKEETDIWKSDAARAAKQIWRASRPEPWADENNNWQGDIKPLMLAAKECNDALGWKEDRDINAVIGNGNGELGQ